MQTTLIDPFELVPHLPPARPPMLTISVDVDFDDFEPPRSSPSQAEIAPDSWTRIRCWCSED